MAYLTFTIWGGMLPANAEVSSWPSAQPNINQKVIEIS